MVSLTRTASLGSFELEFSMCKSERPLSKSKSTPELEFLLQVSSKPKAAPKTDKAASALSPIAEKQPKKRTYLRLRVASPPRYLLILLFFLNLLPIAACATLLSLNKYKDLTRSQARQLTSPLKVQGRVASVRRVKTLAPPPSSAPTRHPAPRATSAGTAPPPFVWPATVHPMVKELGKNIQAAAQSEISKLRQQLLPLETHGPREPAGVPNPATAAVAVAMGVNELLTKSEEQLRLEKSSAAAAAEGGGGAAAAAAGGVSGAAPVVLPAGFELPLALTAATACGECYRSLEGKDGESHTEELAAELRKSGLRLVKEMENPKFDTYALIARSDTELYVVFRGSATLKNLHVDLKYLPADEGTMKAFGREAEMAVPSGVQLHSGFLDAWRSLRADVLAAVDECMAEERARAGPSQGLRLVVTGHSMGGAMAMLASLELQARLAKRAWHPFTNGPVTYTFATPRLGNGAFAKMYNKAFPKHTDHWALQRRNDAVPHLPFAAWGFRHPDGVAFLDPTHGDEGDGENLTPMPTIATGLWARAPEAAGGTALGRRSGDRGDAAYLLRPHGGKVQRWAAYHHIWAYLEPLQDMVSGGYGVRTDSTFQA